MTDKNNIELFDDLFRQQLGNASAPVPPGVWESVASSVSAGAGAGAATAVAAKTAAAIWLKVLIAASVIGAGTFIAYKAMDNNPPVPAAPKVIENPVSRPESEDKASTESVVGGQQGSAVVKEGHEQPDHAQVSSTKAKTMNKAAASNTPPVLHLKNAPAHEFYEIHNEYSDEYLTKLHENEIPKFDTSNNDAVAVKKETATEEPYVPEKMPVLYMVDSSYIFIPNVVTPNGDGLNDEFIIDIRGEEFVQIIIYNTRSEKLFETKNKNLGWNCKLPNGEIAPEGDYIVRVVYKFKNQSKVIKTLRFKLIK